MMSWSLEEAVSYYRGQGAPSDQNAVINLLRSIPFLILMVMVFPLSRLILGTAIGTTATIVPLTVAAAPYVARLVESSLRELDHGVVEAAQSMGCSTWQIITKVMLPECKPSLINGATNASITILGYGAMAGSIGGGGLGAIALMRGYGRNQVIVLYVAVVILVILVQIIQSVGTRLTIKMDRRITHK
jgi:D-methionine transport system permease protein